MNIGFNSKVSEKMATKLLKYITT